MNEKPYSAEYNPKDGITYVMRHGCADWVWADDKSMNDSHAVADILNSAHAAGRATAEAELKAANDTIASASLALHDAQAELAALREALVGVIKEADRETDAFIFARKVLARSETAP